MERTHQLIGHDGLQIPLPLVQRYGLQPGAHVVLEFAVDGIHVLPAMVEKTEIEVRALCYLFRNLGDAVSVDAQQREGGWQVTVFASDKITPLGELTYDLMGNFQENLSTSIEQMRHRAVEMSGA